MTVVYEQERIGDFIQTYTDEFFDVMNPQPSQVNILDIAHALSQLCRFTGHTKYKFYSVGEHSIHCSLLAETLGLSKRIQLIALLHDASEAYCTDVNRPLKQNLPEYKAIEDNVMKVIWEALGIGEVTKEEYTIIKKLDNTLLVNEMKQVMFRDEKSIPELDTFDKSVSLALKVDMELVKKIFLDIYESLSKE